MQCYGPKETACDGKVRFVTRRRAKKTIRKTSDRRKQMRAYRCPYCQGWHIGHVPWTRI